MSNTIFDNTSLFALFFKWRKKIIIASFLAAVIAVVISLFIPNKYKSEVVLFPTMNPSSGKALLHSYNSTFLEIGEEEQLEHMMQILESNEIKSRVVKKFDLTHHYQIDTTNDKYPIKLMKEYDSNVKYSITKN